MKIAVLDGLAVSEGLADPWAPLRCLGDLSVWDRTPAELVLERARDADVAVTNKVRFDAQAIGALPRLKLIAVTATGTNVVDLAAARERGIPVCNTPAYGTGAVAQHTFALILELARRTGLHAASVRRGEWAARPDFCYCLAPQVDLAGKTLGIVGYGALGHKVAEIARAFGMRVIVTPHRLPDRQPGFPEFVPLAELLARSDIVTLHCPLTEQTRSLINAATLAQMKPGAFLVNTARGPLVDEAAAAAALRSGRLAGLAADVLSSEPPSPDNPLVAAPNTVITPHLAWATDGARRNILAITAANIRAWRDGSPQNAVNGPFQKSCTVKGNHSEPSK